MSARTETEDNIHLFAWKRGWIFIGGMSEQAKNSKKTAIFAQSIQSRRCRFNIAPEQKLYCYR